MRIRILLYGLMAFVLTVSFQNCSPFHVIEDGESSLSLDDNKKDDGVMNNIQEDLFAIATTYFPESSTELPAKRLFRLTQRQIDLAAQDLIPKYFTQSVSSKMPKDALQTNYEFSDIINFNTANITPYEEWVSEIASAVEADPRHIIECTQEQNSQQCLEREARSFIQQALRHSASGLTVESYLDFFRQSLNQNSLAIAKSDLVSLLLHSPYFLYRTELETDADDFLRPSDLLNNLTYTLADVPYTTIFGKEYNPSHATQSNAALRSVVRESLAHERARQKLVGFFKSWLEIKEPKDLTGFEATLPGYNAELARAMVNETDQFLRFHLLEAAPRLKDITQSSESFVNETLNQIYDNNQTSDSGPVPMDASKRLGILTQSSFIASHSGPDDTRLVKRGVFFTRKVMCLEIGAVPGNVESELPPENGLMTERQRIETATNTSRCLGCHNYINPFGFIQENYNPLGQWRTRDSHGLPIDSHITVNFLDDKSFSSSDPIESLRYFTDSMRFKQCFVRQLFRYYNGRRETPSDHPLLRKMFFFFALNDNQNLLNLLETMATASRFSQREDGGE